MSARKSSKRPAPLARDPGKEYPDPTPVAVPVQFKQSPSHYDEIKHMIRVAMSDAAQSQDMETFEEANDFEPDFDDDPDFVSNYEFNDLLPENGEDLEPPPPLSEKSPEGTVSPEGAKPPPSGGQGGETPQAIPAAETAGGASQAPRPPAGTSATP